MRYMVYEHEGGITARSTYSSYTNTNPNGMAWGWRRTAEIFPFLNNIIAT